jgi:tRNA dimethylallyltransferase
MVSKETPMIVVVGETASGKSSLAMNIAQRFNGEIICADSWTIYKKMNIGTAKPSLAEREAVPHHMLNLVNPDEPFTVVDFKELAIKKIQQISLRDVLPVMVGGNGLYVDSVLFDYSFLPKGTTKERNRLNQHSLEELLNIAKEKNIDLAGIDIKNKRRLIRALETKGQKPDRSESMRDNTLVVGIKRSKQEMRSRIEDRVDGMFAKGLIHEVNDLLDEYDWEDEAMKGIGYREFEPFINKDISKNELKRRIVRSTVNLAKRQRTWFKKNLQIKWSTSEDEAIKFVESFLKSNR